MNRLQLIHLKIKAQAAVSPDNIALIDPKLLAQNEKGRWTYRELDDVTDRLASWMKKSFMIAEEDAVAIFMPRSARMVIAMLAILKTGGCFVPIEMAYPEDLIADVTTSTKPKALITDDISTFAKLKYEGNTMVLDTTFMNDLPQADQSQLVESDPFNLDRRFFITMSSGTTGRPKGIVQLHSGAAYSFESRMSEDPYFGHPENAVEACNVFFIWEALRPLCYGAQCLVIDDSSIYDPHKLLKIMTEFSVTNMLFTPSLMEMMGTQEGFKAAAQNMQFVTLCGEVVSAVTYRSTDSSLPAKCKLYNSYSISETFDVSAAVLERGNANPPNAASCGVSLPHCKIMILDDKLNLCPPGVDGNVYVAGHSLARGYLDMDELTKAKFVEIPTHLQQYIPDDFPKRMYNCGDNGSWEADQLRIGGRADSMIKIRGYSVELGAITTAIEQVPVINECIVIADGDKAATNKTLVAYFVVRRDLSADDRKLVDDFTQLRRHLIEECRKVLPSYSIPSVFVQLEAIPISNTSGKTDSKQLPNWRERLLEQVNMVRVMQDEMSTPVEKKVLAALRKVLDLDDDLLVDTCDSFFEVGGHSLSATHYLTELKNEILPEHIRGSLSLEDVFRYPKISSLAKYLSRLMGEQIELEDETHDLSQILDILSNDIKPVNSRSFWRALEAEQKWGYTRVLLTGGTGWLGSHLLAYMLRNTDYLITVIVRARNDVPENVVRQCLLKNKLMTDKDIDGYLTRMRCLDGDLSRFDLGLGHDMYQELTTRIDCVVHAAANVNLMLPFSSLRSANVDGTNNILNFCNVGHIKQCHYISTNGVIPSEYSQRISGALPETDDLAVMDGGKRIAQLLPSGYAQTKWIGEQLVRRHQRNGLPCTIYRIGNIGGCNATGMWNPQDSNLAFLRICTKLSAIPLGTDSDALTMELTSTDFICECISGGISNVRAVAGKTIHLIQPTKTPMEHILTAFEHANFPMARVTQERWNDMLKGVNWEPELMRQCSLYLNSPEAVPDMFARHVACHAKNYKLLLGDDDASYPHYSTFEMITALKGLAKNSLLPMPDERPRNLPLLNRLIMVTGASSGIGEAVCDDLVNKGANLIVVARRKGNLETLKARLLANAPTNLPCKPNIFIATADVTDVNSLVKHVATAEAELNDKVWGLVHCAGVMHYMRISSLETDIWHQEIDVNCKGTVNAIRAVLPSMQQCNRGHIVCISSDAGKKAFDGLAVYSGTKSFVEFFCESLRREVAPHIKVTTIAPGDVVTELLFHNKDPEALASFGAGSGAEMLQPSDIAETIGFVMTRKDHSAINSIIIEPREAPI